ncbi:imidazole glycerol phosphate synthase subunit HisH [Allopusillimonas ginsengisoli]|uniref:imidazole glycerol phosphate synthase subunit HisH n=1 Tax=Allopusillimonas ginsengisoli TaxID=453575 RepID=UPI00101F42D3|nr:imidazole glycerol phosphate synthase subunit HisH [Allopusillimonas ginsengisoli]TEA77869.1 imidazole glycerol phosphate synthase subunit HisH [Allopusillimonas ginsengisoli]
MIAILDYGMGNIASIRNMMRRVGGDAVITSDLESVDGLSGIILPGVGAFDNAMQKLNASGIADTLRDFVLERKIPFLGVCLGMQLLFESSEEGKLPGLGFIRGEVRRFKGPGFDAGKLKIPHMGWNIVRPIDNAALFVGLDQEPRFYFVHSYHAVCTDDDDIAATCSYGYDFTCSVSKENIYAAQFHPEKSHRFGMKLFENFMERVC